MTPGGETAEHAPAVVWVVRSGESGGPSSVDGVFATEERAIAMAPKLATAAFSGGWKRDRHTVGNVVAAWTNGCDWLSVERWEVTP